MSDAALPTVRTVAALRARVRGWREAGQRVALVPTMGALHEGHLSLVRLAKAQAERVVVSIFVNPAQFAPGEDFEAYPRDEARDARLLRGEGCDLLYAPEPQEMYPPGYRTEVKVAGMSDVLCGMTRPTHFQGVATVVAKLFVQSGADLAVFGEKDWQQLQVIRRAARDLDLPVAILGAPILRAPDGLALSSRNAYMTPEERDKAPRLNQVLLQAARALAGGAPVERVEAEALEALRDAGFERIDYFEVRAPEDLERLGPGPVTGAARVLAAAWMGRTRLIDNVPVQAG